MVEAQYHRLWKVWVMCLDVMLYCFLLYSLSLPDASLHQFPAIHLALLAPGPPRRENRDTPEIAAKETLRVV